MAVKFTDFLGRAHEVDALRQAFNHARIGNGRVVWVVGDAGMGKTRLLNELTSRVVQDGETAVVGHCLQSVNAPYLPIVDIFQALFDDLPPIADPQDTPVKPVSVRKAASFASLHRRLHDFAKKQSLLLCVEDLHYADAGTIEVLQYLCCHLLNSSILLLLTTRDVEGTRRNELLEFFTTSSRDGADVIRLEPLDASDIHCLIRKALWNGCELQRQTIDRIETLAEGNPFFAEELLRGISRQPLQSSVVTNIPITLRSTIGSRLRALDQTTRNALAFAAVSGREFDVEFLQQVAGLSRDTILLALRQACAEHVIDEVTSSSGSFRYHHALIRAMVYEDLLDNERRNLHIRVAELLEKMPPTGSQLFELAYHWAEAGSPSKALDYNERAGDAATSIFAYCDAAKFYERALDFEVLPGEHRAILCEKIAQALFAANVTTDILSWFERALREYSRLDNREKMAEMLIAMSRQSWNDANTEAGIVFASQALDVIAPLPSNRLHALATVMIASYHSLFCRADETMKQLECVGVQVRRENPDIAARFYDSRAMAHVVLRQMGDAIADFEGALEAADACGDPLVIVRVYGQYASVLQRLGKMDRAIQCWHQVLALTQESGLVGRGAFTKVMLAGANLLLGKLAVAREYIESTVTRLVDMPAVRICRSGFAVRLGLLLGDDDLVRGYADWETLELAFKSAESARIGEAIPPLVDLLLRDRKFSQARSLLRRAILAIDDAYECGELCVQVAANGDASDIPKAFSLLNAAVCGDDDIVGHAFVALFKAEEANRRSVRNRQVASTWGLAAASLFAKTGWPVHGARALKCAGRVSEALAVYRDIGANGEVARLERKIAVRNQRGHYRTSLTQREHEVAAFAAQGFTNKQIANELLISENTVEHHLQSVYNRLGINSREELSEASIAQS